MRINIRCGREIAVTQPLLNLLHRNIVCHEQALLKSAQDPSGIPISEQTLQTLPVPFVDVSEMCQITSKPHTDSIVIQVSAPGFKLKVTGEAAMKALKEIERVLRNA